MPITQVKEDVRRAYVAAKNWVDSPDQANFEIVDRAHYAVFKYGATRSDDEIDAELNGVARTIGWAVTAVCRRDAEWWYAFRSACDELDAWKT